MATYEVTTKCGKCKGTGTYSSYYGGSQDCPLCGGDGKLAIGEVVLDDIEDSISDIMDKCNDIKEVVDEL